MDAEAKRDVTIVASGNVEAIGLREVRRIPIGRADRGDDHRPFGDRAAVDLDVRVGDARRPLHRTVVPQQLLHRAVNQRRIVSQPAELVRMAQEGQHPIADEVDGRLMPRDEEQDAGGEQLPFAQLVARFFGGDQQAQQIVLWMAAALGEKTAEVVGQLAACGPPTRHDLGVRWHPDRIQTPGHVGRPLANGALIPRRHTQHLADHRDRERVREIGNDVHPARVLDPIQEPVDDIPDMRPHGLDHAGREGLAHERPQAGVIGWVTEEHRAGKTARFPVVTVDGGEQVLEPIAPEARIAKDHDDVVVPREHPEAHGCLVYRLDGTQPVIERIRVRVELGPERVEQFFASRHATSSPLVPPRQQFVYFGLISGFSVPSASHIVRRRPARSRP